MPNKIACSMAPSAILREYPLSLPVRVVSHSACVLGPEARLSFAHPLSRRMTPLQKALLEVAHRVEATCPNTFAELVRESGCPLYFGTAFGELSSNLAMLAALQRKELPLSPTAFQHSVHNCPVGYLSILMGLKNPMVTLCGGREVAHKALSLGVAHLRRGADVHKHKRSAARSAAFVLVADELREKETSLGGSARAEALLLELCSLEEVEHATQGVFLLDEVHLPTCPSGEAQASEAVWPWILGPDSGSVERPVLEKDTEGFPRASETRWIFRS